uniref:Uncharacterized protein n=1 Tax=Ixodes ricinus TaxID=34613 RepID=V5HTH7_IXORI
MSSFSSVGASKLGLCVTLKVRERNAICNTPPSKGNLGGTHAGWAYYSSVDICRKRSKFESNDFSKGKQINLRPIFSVLQTWPDSNRKGSSDNMTTTKA